MRENRQSLDERGAPASKSSLRRTLARWLLGAAVPEGVEGAASERDALGHQLRELASSVRALESALASSSDTAIEPIREWIRGAEAHLAALQAGYQRQRDAAGGHAASMSRIQETLTQLAARIADLEQADTDIALAIARTRTRDGPP